MDKITLYPSKKPAPLFVPITGMILMGIAGFCLFKSLTTRNISLFPVSLMCFIVYKILDNSFSWYKEATLIKTGKSLEYTVTELVNTLGRDKTKYQVASVSKIKPKGNSLIVYGDIKKIRPFRHPSAIKKVEIKDCTNEAKTLLTSLQFGVL